MPVARLRCVTRISAPCGKPRYECLLARRQYFDGGSSVLASSSPPPPPAETPWPRRRQLVVATEQWFHTVVLGQKLCPFAAHLVRKRGGSDRDDGTRHNHHDSKLRIVASSAVYADQAVQDVSFEARFLMQLDDKKTALERHEHETKDNRHETTLVILDDAVAHFARDFVDFVRFSWRLQQEVILENGLDEQLQLVLFHPRAVHQTYNSTAADDEWHENAADYTIRAPYPTIHLLREVDVLEATAVSKYPNLEQLPVRNQAKLKAQGVEMCRARLQACYDAAHAVAAVAKDDTKKT